MTTTLSHELDQMHAAYVDAVNSAVEAGDVDLALELGASYDDEAITLVAERENLTHLLPIRRPLPKGEPRRRFLGRRANAA